MRRFSIGLTVLSLLVALVSIAAAPMSSGNVTLISVVYVPEKGPVFTFHVTGHFSRSELKGFVHVENGEDFVAHCTQVDESTVKCGTSKATAGKQVSITWAGSTFWATVPEAPVFCYGVWHYWTQESFENGWTDFGPHCQDGPAHEGDQISYTVPLGTFPNQQVSFDEEVWFVNDPETCAMTPGLPNHGPAYYWKNCW